MKKQSKVIFHVDMNAFYSTVEQILQPKLKNKPIAVVGSNVIYNKGVVLTASYEAREFGVKSAMPVFQAKELCPELILVPARFSEYRSYSKRMNNLLMSYTPLVEVASVDEVYMDVTSLKVYPPKLAEEIQQRLINELGLKCSIGIAPNKFLAKMASDMKKPMGITILRKREVPHKLWPLPINQMFGIGKKTSPRLKEVGILTIGDLVKPVHQANAKAILGNQFMRFYQNAYGIGDNIVSPEKNDTYKSIGHSTTLVSPLYDEQLALKTLKELTEMVVIRLNRYKYMAKTVSVQIRFRDFRNQSRSLTVDRPISTFMEIYEIAENLFSELWEVSGVRLIGVSTSNLIDKADYQVDYNLFNFEKHIEDEKLVKTVYQLKRKFGEKAVQKGLKDK